VQKSVLHNPIRADFVLNLSIKDAHMPTKSELISAPKTIAQNIFKKVVLGKAFSSKHKVVGS